MSLYLAICSSCAIDRDQAGNTVNHQALVDELNAEAEADGWQGVKVSRVEAHRGRTYVEIEPGRSPLTLDYLRRMKEAGTSNQPETRPAETGEQGRLI